MSDHFTAKELRSKPEDQLRKILAQLREKLRHVRFQVASKEVKNLREVRFVRREIARVLTILHTAKPGGPSKE